jgi:WD40 repeat protein
VGDGAQTRSSTPSQVDAFVSYSRKDGTFVSDLQAFLVAQDKTVWIDFQDIPPSARWEQQIEAGIAAAHAVVFVISPDSLASPTCRRELEHASAHGKRIVPLLRRDVEATDLPPPLSELNWILCRDRDDQAAGFTAVVRAIETDLDWVYAHTRLLVHAIEWQRAGRDRGFLLHGTDLTSAEHWLTTQTGRQPAPTELHLVYLRESRRAATRRQRLVFALVLVALAVTAVLAVAALVQRNSARRATTRAEVEASNALASNAEFELARDPATSVRLALQAARLDPTPAATSVLRRALAHSYVRLILQTGQSQAVDVAVSTDGKKIAGASLDGTARVWDATTGRLLHRFRGDGEVTSVGFNRSGVLLIVTRSGSSRGAEVFDVRSGRRINTLRSQGVLHAQFGASDRVVTGSAWTGAALWDGRTGRRLVAVTPHSCDVVASALAPDGTTFATASCDEMVIWDARTGRRLASYRTPTHAYLTYVVYSPDGRLIAVTAEDGSASILDSRTGAVRQRLTGARATLFDVVFSPDGQLLAAASADGTARIWTIGGRPVTVLVHDGPVRDVEFSADGTRVVTASDDGTAGVWNPSTGKELVSLRGHSDRVNRAIFSPDGSRVLTASNDGTVRVWDIAPPIDTLKPSDAIDLAGARVPTTTTGSPAEPTFTPDWSLYAVALGPETRVLDARSGHTVANLQERGRTATAAFFSADGRRLLTIYEDGHARIWEAGSWKQGALIDDSGPEPFGTLSPDGRRVVMASYDSAVVRVWDATTGKFLAELHGHKRTALGGLVSVRFSADGTRLATAAEDGTARVWDTKTWRQLAVLPGAPNQVTDAQISPDGQRIITASEDGNARLWSKDGALIALMPTTEKVSPAEIGPRSVAAAFSPDSKLAATVGADGTARIWNAKSGRILATLRPPGEPHNGRLPNVTATLPVTTADFDRTSSLLVTAGFDGTLRVWDARSGDQVAEYQTGTTPTTAGDENYALFAPDGTHILFSTDTRGIKLLECTICGSLAELITRARSSFHSTAP